VKWPQPGIVQSSSCKGIQRSAIGKRRHPDEDAVPRFMVSMVSKIDPRGAKNPDNGDLVGISD